MMTIYSLILFFNLNAPPGTIKIKNYFVDKTEIQNIHWLEYIYYKKQELDSIEFKKTLPDSSNTWYSFYEFRYQPIVLITYEQALDYCAWRSEFVSQKFGKKITYRLPTITEWKEIAEEIIKANQKQLERELLETKKKIILNAYQYLLFDKEKPNSRIYNMFDNVSEMTLENGIAMGSNNNDLSFLRTNLNRVIKYNSPHLYLGFRCVAEIE